MDLEPDDLGARVFLGRALLANNRGADAVRHLAFAYRPGEDSEALVRQLLMRAMDWLRARNEAEEYAERAAFVELRDEVNDRKESGSPADRRFRLEGRRIILDHDFSLPNLIGFARESRFSDDMGDGDAELALVKSLSLYERALQMAKTNQDRSVVLTGKSKVLLEMGRVTNALEIANQAFELDNKNSPHPPRVLSRIHSALSSIDKRNAQEHREISQRYYQMGYARERARSR